MRKTILLGVLGLLLLGGATLGFAQERQRAQRQDASCATGDAPGHAPGEATRAGRGDRAAERRADRPMTRGQGEGRGQVQGEHRGRRGERLLERVQDAKRFVRSLELTEQQREELRRMRRELAPIAKELRPELRDVRDGARELRRAGKRAEAREYLRQELRPLRAEARERGLPLVRPLIDQLTPEQRAKCEERARAHGREFDPDRAARRLGAVLGLHGMRARTGDTHGR
ncbi:MAG: Spy/CpxP family protein refolding chaperone [Planctomycetes bacterium]|nr:Spy/CpxP family protein refolding chaperone [Planctomycetota bacterium]